MLFNVRDLLKTTVSIEIEFNDLTPTLVSVICEFADNHDSRFPIRTGSTSIASSFGLDELYYVDDTVLNLLMTNYARTYFRLVDLLVYDQVILDVLLLDSHVQEANIDYAKRDTELATCLLLIRKAILEMVMQLA